MVTTGVQLKVSRESRPGAGSLVKKKIKAGKETPAGLISEGPQDRPDQEICRKWSLLRRCTWQKGSLPYFGFSQQEWADMGAEQQLGWQTYRGKEK